METLNSDECAGGAVGHIGCANCHDWLLCGPAGPAGIPCGWLYGMLLGPADIGMYRCPDGDAWVRLGAGLGCCCWLGPAPADVDIGCRDWLGPAAVDIEVLMGCTEGLRGGGGWAA